MYSKDFLKLTLSQFVAQIYKQERPHITESLFHIFLTPPPQASSLSNSLLIIMSTSCEPTPLPPLSLTKCITTVFQKPDFHDNLKHCKTKRIQNMISRTRNLFTFPDLTLLFQFSYRFFIFCYVIFNLFPQFLSSFKLQLLFISKDHFNAFSL